MLDQLGKLEKFKDLKLGNFRHYAASLHIYVRNFNKVRAMLGLDKDAHNQ